MLKKRCAVVSCVALMNTKPFKEGKEIRAKSLLTKNKSKFDTRYVLRRFLFELHVTARRGNNPKLLWLSRQRAVLTVRKSHGNKHTLQYAACS